MIMTDTFDIAPAAEKLFDKHGNLKPPWSGPFPHPLKEKLDGAFDESNFTIYRYRVFPEQYDEDGEPVGIWNLFGYITGRDGYGEYDRRESLLKLFCSYLLPEKTSQQSYLHGFGKPVSRKRYERIRSFINSQIKQKKYNPIMKLAVEDWKSDIEWLNRYLSRLLVKGDFELCPNQDDPSIPLIDLKLPEPLKLKVPDVDLNVVLFASPEQEREMTEEEMMKIIATL